MESLTFIHYTDEEGEVEITLITKYEVCPRCHGSGTHVNPAIDGNGITQSEMDELGDDFREDYLSGVYDVVCEECNGRNVVPVPDPDRNTKENLEAYEQHLQDRRDYLAEIAAEQRMGA